MARDLVRERLLMEGPRALSDADLLSMLGAGDAASRPVGELAWLTVAELRRLGVGEARAAAIVAAFELGRRGAWAPPRRGERCLDPGRVYEFMRPLAHAQVEEFHVVLLDVRGRLIRTERVAQGSVSQCPVSPRDTLRTAVREGAHGVVFVHNHPSGDATPSIEDGELTERLRAASELVGVMARDHVIVASSGYYSFVEAGRWRR
ncbi:MAG: DNA repair protein RadC [Anaeromyxobacteraceae bacterium]|nr:DNA repair protein RadC [Anaeromyxobacteraceae bacterium]